MGTTPGSVGGYPSPWLQRWAVSWLVVTRCSLRWWRGLSGRALFRVRLCAFVSAVLLWLSFAVGGDGGNLRGRGGLVLGG